MHGEGAEKCGALAPAEELRRCADGIYQWIHVRGGDRPTRRFWKAHRADWENAHVSDLGKSSRRDLIYDEEIGHCAMVKARAGEFARKRLRGQFTRVGEGAKVFEKILSPDALTIGFARRFATYKRAPLIFSDLARAIAIFNDPKQPVQLVFAGKAHPRDDRGKEFIQRIHEITRRNEFFGEGDLP